ncbi:T7SS effector LXG polymorphic toxin [Virgibacillus necropolis]|nr:T7SS effector LXG polymorphic toxin [Virgibacillus necropolis]
MTSQKTLESNTLINSMENRAKEYESLRVQFTHLQNAVQGIISLDGFTGKGADAIKAFYQAQNDVIAAWIDLIDVRVAFFTSIMNLTDQLELSGETVVQVPFLEQDLHNAYNRANDIVTSQQDNLRGIFQSINDIVPLDVFSRATFDEQIDHANKERKDTIDNVNTLDENLVNEYERTVLEENLMMRLFSGLLNATQQGGTISPINFNANAYHTSEAFESIDDVKKETSSYLDVKEKQMDQREQRLKMEELENRPWYEKAWDTTSVFIGEVTGYYDTKRAATGIDPVTGEKLSEADRIKAGAFAAAGFIPFVGWAGRIAKGGKAIYATTKGAKAVDSSLDAYKYAKSLDYLHKAEYGIYGLASANGFSEYITGKDMFGNELTEDQQQQSLTEALFMLGVGGVGYKLDGIAGGGLKAKDSVNEKTIKTTVSKTEGVNVGEAKVIIGETDKAKIDKWGFRPDDEKYLRHKEIFDNPKYYNQETGNINWPPNDGFDGETIKMTLENGTLIDRYGEAGGSFFSPEGIPYEQRALALHSGDANYYVYRVVDSFNVDGGKIAPWFGYKGGGTQFVKYHENGEMYSIQELIDGDYIELVSTNKGGVK